MMIPKKRLPNPPETTTKESARNPDDILGDPRELPVDENLSFKLRKWAKAFHTKGMLQAQTVDFAILKLWELTQGNEIYQPTPYEVPDTSYTTKVNGLVCKKDLHDGGELARVVVPLAPQKRVIEQAHCQSNLGVRGTTNSRTSWQIPSMPRSKKRVTKD